MRFCVEGCADDTFFGEVFRVQQLQSGCRKRLAGVGKGLFYQRAPREVGHGGDTAADQDAVGIENIGLGGNGHGHVAEHGLDFGGAAVAGEHGVNGRIGKGGFLQVDKVFAACEIFHAAHVATTAGNSRACNSCR